MLCGEDEGEGAPLESPGVAMHVGAGGPLLLVEQASAVRCICARAHVQWHEALKQVLLGTLPWG